MGNCITSGGSLGYGGTTTASIITGQTIGQYGCLFTNWTGVTITSLAEQSIAQLRLLRDTSNANDDYGQDIGFAYLQLRYKKLINSGV